MLGVPVMTPELDTAQVFAPVAETRLNEYEGTPPTAESALNEYAELCVAPGSDDVEIASGIPATTMVNVFCADSRAESVALTVTVSVSP